MIEQLKKTFEESMKAMDAEQKQLKELKAKMSPKDLKFINSFHAEVNKAKGDMSKITQITKKYFGNYGASK